MLFRSSFMNMETTALSWTCFNANITEGVWTCMFTDSASLAVFACLKAFSCVCVSQLVKPVCVNAWEHVCMCVCVCV